MVKVDARKAAESCISTLRLRYQSQSELTSYEKKGITQLDNVFAPQKGPNMNLSRYPQELAENEAMEGQPLAG